MDADRADQAMVGGDSARPSAECEAFIKGWESCSLVPYLDSAGRWTTGWGHLMQPSDPRVAITQDEADSLFLLDLLPTSDAVARLIIMPLTQYRFDALVAFAFNVGTGALAGSTLRKRVNGGYFGEAADEFLKWDIATNPRTGAKAPNAGLAKRRAAERAIFLSADYSGRP